MTRLEADYALWLNYDASIDIVASPNVRIAFDSQATHHRNFIGSYGRALQRLAILHDPKIGGKGRWIHERKMGSDWSTIQYSRKDLIADRDNFVKYARRDMGQE